MGVVTSRGRARGGGIAGERKRIRRAAGAARRGERTVPHDPRGTVSARRED